MFDWWRIDEADLGLFKALKPLTRIERERLEALAEIEGEPYSPRRWVAGALVKLGLRIAPEALAAVPVRIRA